ITNDNISMINYSEVKDPILIKIRDCGVTLKGYWHERPIIMEYIPNNLKNQDNETIKQLVSKKRLGHVRVDKTA
ncbi:15951_t:CDS:1, partial [Gigaspora margarita]